MTGKDWLTLGLSAAAFIVAFASFYFAHVHKPSGAMLILLERTFTPRRARSTNEKDAAGFFLWEEVSPLMRHLKYSLSNTGKQTLYVKDVELLQGPDPRGYFRSSESFTIIPSDNVEGFLIEPGDIKIIEINHAMNFHFGEDYDYNKNCYQLLGLILVSADGSRYQICHDITNLGASGPDLHHPIWDGQTLGSPVRGTGFV
ncbi:hypothetical protein M5G20_26020 [Pseudomonas sp. TNT2022 ID1044]|uniref:hypothetical protein n=1 Tax=Pseudomonas sp. TNT2022 ID1044 TaxID=2942636 RepID=UPI00235E8DAE|nr:hypothetical protein [Pseudomonas sp. TNT2022 ID1044]MDD0999300.1 hypothetical protein [Pseudomonas sp. TNT2022 ID1044]